VLIKGEVQGEIKQVGELQARCESYSKERAALKTIIEEKFGTLVADISRSVSEAESLVRIPFFPAWRKRLRIPFLTA
jgi:hypothetical protein